MGEWLSNKRNKMVRICFANGSKRGGFIFIFQRLTKLRISMEGDCYAKDGTYCVAELSTSRGAARSQSASGTCAN